MNLRDLKIGTRLTLGFGLITVLIIVSFYLVFSRVETLTELTEKIYNHPFAVTNAVNSVQFHSRYIQDLLHQSVIFPEHIDSVKKIIDSLDEKIMVNIQLARQRYLGDKTDLELFSHAYNKLSATRSAIISDIESGKIEDAILKLKKREGTVEGNNSAIEKVLKFALNKSSEFHATARQTREESLLMISVILFLLLLFTSAVSFAITRDLKWGVNLLLEGVRKVGRGDYGSKIVADTRSEIGLLADEVNIVSDSLLEYSTGAAASDWVKSGLNRLGALTREVEYLEAMSSRIADFMAGYLNAGVVAIYVNRDTSSGLTLTGGFGLPDHDSVRASMMARERLLGEAAAKEEYKILTGLDETYFKISSGTGEMLPKALLLLPLRSKSRIVGVLEAGLFAAGIDGPTGSFLNEAAETIGLTIESALAKEELTATLKRTQDLAEELNRQGEELRESNIRLETQQEELRVANEELEEHANALRLSEAKLKSQQEELEVVNEELEEKNTALQIQKAEVQRALEDVELKAEELARSSKYKSEFLANMSHELRTPLNSLLILSQMLMDNKSGNLSHEEVESAAVINKSGADLLDLINEILDLSKIEAGKMELHFSKVNVQQVFKSLESLFKHPVSKKGLDFEIIIEDETPIEIDTDRMRLEQVLKNLLTNAIKFTQSGSISLKAGRPEKDTVFGRKNLTPENTIAISVIDTGIGIPYEKQKIIFEAFQQADGSTSREYGGTGLGLSISRELARLLGGAIGLKSRPGQGSEFTIYLPVGSNQEQSAGTMPETGRKHVQAPGKAKGPLEIVAPVVRNRNTRTGTVPSETTVKDDRDSLTDNDRTVLVIEDDPVFADLLYKECREQGLKTLVALNGTDGLDLVERFKPIGILLDLGLPDMNGLDLLTTLKENSATRHIPVHIITGSTDSRFALQKGAIGFLTKPVGKADIDEALRKVEDFHAKKVKDILLIEDDPALRNAISKLIGDSDVKITPVDTGKAAIRELGDHSYDLVILDLGLPDMTGFDLLHFIDENQLDLPPIIVYTGKDLTREEDSELRHYAESIIIKGVRSEERLLDEAALFLHRLVDKMPEQKRRMIIDLHETDAPFRDKTVLIVDDDMRNVFAISKLLSDKGMNILKAENGQKALDIINTAKGIDLILMDIMMPVMDGYETMRRIRMIEEFYKIPIIAITAKAMKKDYEECIAAGASDYLPKPVDIDRLFSMLRVWLYR
ncbi:MAG: hypothetical protein AMXMBFR49_08310 [Chlorobiota bacterium]|nr:MAG: response regulator [Chlorobiota bacterium]